jgi:hypothetical protein
MSSKEYPHLQNHALRLTADTTSVIGLYPEPVQSVRHVHDMVLNYHLNIDLPQIKTCIT